ncbi:MAG: tRNA lysidine(34) synthetase TilS [Frankiales bacterium]|nr:tRNA lysidine(34) synthetase TilS [Frankiales bacterium]
MTGPPAATAAVRLAVRRALPAGPVAAAVSGGADSLALAAALARLRPEAYALVVDHGLQPGSPEVAQRAADRCRALGLRAEVLTACALEDAQHHGAGDLPKSTNEGPEARARTARYELLAAAADRLSLEAVLLGHTLDDQAETVLLGLARGSGARALAGMASRRGRYRRPLLALDRATVRAACDQAGLIPWEDPHNADEAYARVRVRRTALPGLEGALGPGVAAALARTADQLREDADALDGLTPDLAHEPDCEDLSALPAALRSRALKRWAERESGRAVTSVHVSALRALVERWHGQGAVDLPGGARVERHDGRLTCRRD